MAYLEKGPAKAEKQVKAEKPAAAATATTPK